MNKIEKIIIAGEGGQGVQVIAKILAQAAFDYGKEATYIPNFGVEQRGGVSVAFVQFGEGEVVFPKFAQADIAVILSERSVERVINYLGQETTVIYNSSFIKETNKLKGKFGRLKGIDASNLARHQFTPRVFNMMILGAISAFLKGLPKEEIIKTIDKTLAYKYKAKPELAKLNLEAFDEGYRLINS